MVLYGFKVTMKWIDKYILWDSCKMKVKCLICLTFIDFPVLSYYLWFTKCRNSIKQMHPSHGLNSIKKALLTVIVPETCGMLLGLTNPNNSTGSSVNPILW